MPPTSFYHQKNLLNLFHSILPWLTRLYNRNHNHKHEISTEPTKAKSRESSYSHALVQNKIDRQRVRSIESGRQAGRQTVRRLWWMVFGVETGREGGGRGQIKIGFVEKQCFKFGVKQLWRGSKGWGFGSAGKNLRFFLEKNRFLGFLGFFMFCRF